MRPWERRAFHICALVVVTTGLAFLWMKYFIASADPFALVNHPWQPAMLALHVLASPPFILVFGVVFNSHVMKKLKASGLPNRRSGYVSLATFAVMVVSGYLLQVITDESLLTATVVAHVAAGGTFAVSYSVHLILGWTIARRPVRPQVREVA
jgi:hypothetical protein